MGIRNWITATSLWIRDRENGLRNAIISALIYGTAAYVASKLFERDFVYLWALGVIICGIGVILCASLPLANTKIRGSSFIFPLIVIFTALFFQESFRWVFVALDRPRSMFSGFWFDVFVGSIGVLVSGFLGYVVTIGHMRGKVKQYMGVFALCVIVPLFIAAIVFYFN